MGGETLGLAARSTNLDSSVQVATPWTEARLFIELGKKNNIEASSFYGRALEDR
jgi:hypothetical protein